MNGTAARYRGGNYVCIYCKGGPGQGQAEQIRKKNSKKFHAATEQGPHEQIMRNSRNLVQSCVRISAIQLSNLSVFCLLSSVCMQKASKKWSKAESGRAVVAAQQTEQTAFGLCSRFFPAPPVRALAYPGCSPDIRGRSQRAQKMPEIRRLVSDLCRLDMIKLRTALSASAKLGGLWARVGGNHSSTKLSKLSKEIPKCIYNTHR